MHKLKENFYARDTHAVARELLGKILVRRWRGREMRERIMEVEAYVGQDDKACHASRGMTKRNAVMFKRAGLAYVYLIYGMYHCLNIVTEKEGFPAAVLIRGTQSHAGPGILCREMRISGVQNGEDMAASGKLFVADDGYTVSAANITKTPRIGVDYAGEDAKRLWRYVLEL